LQIQEIVRDTAFKFNNCFGGFIFSHLKSTGPVLSIWSPEKSSLFINIHSILDVQPYFSDHEGSCIKQVLHKNVPVFFWRHIQDCILSERPNLNSCYNKFTSYLGNVLRQRLSVKTLREDSATW
jgi:hypothetical protein